MGGVGVIVRQRCPECGYCVVAVTRTAVAEGLVDHLDWHMAQGHPEAA